MREGHDVLRLSGAILFTHGECRNQKYPFSFTIGEKRFRALGQDPPTKQPRFPRKPGANDPPRRPPIDKRTKMLPEPVSVVLDDSVVLLLLDHVFRT